MGDPTTQGTILLCVKPQVQQHKYVDICVRVFQYLLDEVPSIDGEVRGQIEFTFQDLIDGLLPVFGCEWRLEENQRRVRTAGGCDLSTGI